MKLLDFLKTLNSGAKPAISADDLGSERRALLHELQALQELLDASDTDTRAHLHAAINTATHMGTTTIDLRAIFDAELDSAEADCATPTLAAVQPVPKPVSQQALTQSLLDELRQLQQKALGDNGD